MGLSIYRTGLYENKTRLQNKNYYRNDLKRSRLKKVSIDKSNFEYVAFTGSSFDETEFRDCNLNYMSMQCCDFYNSKILYTHNDWIMGTNFSQSNFTNCKFLDIAFKGDTFSQCYFMNTSFINCIYRSSTFENSIFDTCEFNNLIMAHLNLEYIKFKGTNKFNNVLLSFYQVPYMLKFMDCFDINANEISLLGKNTQLTWKDYKEILLDIAACYFDCGELYPVANILASLGDKESSSKMVLDGIYKSLRLNDFRMVFHFCNLGTEYGLLSEIDKNAIKIDIFNTIRKEIVNSELKNKYLIYAGEIENILTNDGTKDKILLTIYTNIQSTNMESAKELIGIISKSLDYFKKPNEVYKIEVSHNSPFILDLSINVEDAISACIFIYGCIRNYISSKKYKKYHDAYMTKLEEIEINGKKYNELAEQNKKLYEDLVKCIEHKRDLEIQERRIIEYAVTEVLHRADDTKNSLMRLMKILESDMNPIIDSPISECHHKIISNNNYPSRVLVNGIKYD